MKLFVGLMIGLSFALISTIGYPIDLKQLAATTKTTKIDGATTLIERTINLTPISHLSISLDQGQAHLPEVNRPLNAVAFDAMTLATLSYSKQDIFNITEKQSIAFDCGGGIEFSSCQVESVSENFESMVSLVASALREPLFLEEDLRNVIQRRASQFSSDIQNPESRANTLVNRIYYESNHPYRLLPDDAVERLKSITANEVRGYHKAMLDKVRLTITYVGPSLSVSQRRFLQNSFKGIGKGRSTPLSINPPVGSAKEKIVFESRDIPTAYVRLKFNSVGAASPEVSASRLLFEILSENLHEEVRTKRSLSYAVHGMSLQMQQGIGTIAASTSKPKETLEVIAMVVKKLKEEALSVEKLAEYKNVFTTALYLSMETHQNLASALMNSHLYRGKASELYFIQSQIAKVTPAMIQDLAKKTLTNMKAGVVFEKSKFKEDWLQPVLSL